MTQEPITPAATPAMIQRPAPRNAVCHGQHDADDQAGFEDFTEDNDQRCKHQMPHFTTRMPLVVARMEIVKEFIAAGLLRPDVDDGFAVAGEDFLNP